MPCPLLSFSKTASRGKKKYSCMYKFLFLETYLFFTAFVHKLSDFLLLVLISWATSLIQLFLRTGLSLGSSSVFSSVASASRSRDQV